MRSYGPVLLGVIALASCGDPDRTPVEFTPSAVKIARSGDDEKPILAAIVPTPTGAVGDRTLPREPWQFALHPVPPATVTGEGRIGSVGAQSTVTLGIAGGFRGVHYESALHRGSCAAPGAVIAPLNPISSDSLGAGRAISQVALPLDTVGQGYVVILRQEGRSIACGEVGGPRAAPSPPVDPAHPSPPE